jgi:hypothetical protein
MPKSPSRFLISEENPALEALISLEEAMASLEKNGALLSGRVSAEQLWGYLEMFLHIVRYILSQPHWSEERKNPQIVDSGEMDELSNAKLVRRRTNSPYLLPEMTKGDRDLLDSIIASCRSRIELGYHVQVPTPQRGPSQAEIFYSLRQMRKREKRRQVGKSRGGKKQQKASKGRR